MACSPSPITKTSINSDIGSGLKAQGPPAVTIGSSSFLSLFLIEILDISNIFKIVG